MRPRAILPALTAIVLFGIPGLAIAIDWQSPCYTVQDTAADIPRYVVMGYTSMRLSHTNTFEVDHESFYDGLNVDDPMSVEANRDTGTVDCDTEPEIRANWGYNLDDATAADCGNMSVAVTYYARYDATQYIGCGYTSSGFTSAVVAYTVDTCPDAAGRFQHHSGMSLGVAVDDYQSSCDDHVGQFLHVRGKGVASWNFGTGFSGTIDDSACITAVIAAPGSCFGSGLGCI